MKKTHKVLDIAMLDKDGVYSGTEAECHDWVTQQGLGYQVVPMTEEEMEIINSI